MSSPRLVEKVGLYADQSRIAPCARILFGLPTLPFLPPRTLTRPSRELHVKPDLDTVSPSHLLSTTSNPHRHGSEPTHLCCPPRYLAPLHAVPPPHGCFRHRRLTLPDRARADIAQLLRRFENIIAFESVRLALLERGVGSWGGGIVRR